MPLKCQKQFSIATHVVLLFTKSFHETIICKYFAMEIIDKSRANSADFLIKAAGVLPTENYAQKLLKSYYL